MLKFRSVLVAILFVSAPLFTLSAWNKPGHMLTGAIAYYTLKKENPAKLAEALAVLKQHPSMNEEVVGLYPKMGEKGITWKACLDSLPVEDRDLGLFMLAARWADDARDFKGPDGEKKYYPKDAKRDFWHFIDIPYVFPANEGKVTPHEPPSINILAALEINRTATGDAEAKAVALGWVFHLVGDIHQPLHCVALFGPEDHLNDEDGDKGGNELFVKKSDSASRSTNLHSFWDDYMDAGKDAAGFRKVKKRAQELLARADLKRKKFPQIKTHVHPKDWAEETHQLAREAGYSNGHLAFSLDKSTGVPLTDAYKTNAHAVQEKQIVLAGLRLADWLKGK
jgi:S1/P1 Nuclease